MVRESFDESFERLRNQSNHLADIERPEDSFDITVDVVHMTTVLDRRGAGAASTDYPTLEPGETAIATGVWTLRNAEICPTTVDDVNQGDLVVHFQGGANVSRSFKVSRSI